MATCEKCMHEKCCIFAAERHTLFTKGDCEYYDNATIIFAYMHQKQKNSRALTKSKILYRRIRWRG